MENVTKSNNRRTS